MTSFGARFGSRVTAMATYVIKPSHGVEGVTCRSKEDPSRSLQTLAGQLAGDPTLVELNDGAGRLALVGVGSPVSTVVVMDTATGVRHRALSPTHGDEEDRWEPGMPTEEEGDVWFSLMGGESTLIPRNCVISTGLALTAAVEWVVSGQLGPDLNWLL